MYFKLQELLRTAAATGPEQGARTTQMAQMANRGLFFHGFASGKDSLADQLPNLFHSRISVLKVERSLPSLSRLVILRTIGLQSFEREELVSIGSGRRCK